MTKTVKKPIPREEVVCLGWCNKTFFRVGKQVGNPAIRRCASCRQKSANPKSAWMQNWG